MGEIVVEVQLENSGDRVLFERGFASEDAIRQTTIQAVADTGALMLALPQDVVAALDLGYRGTMAVRYPDGRDDRLPLAGDLTIQIGDRRMAAECVVVPTGADALIGQIVMERLDLIADPKNQSLTPRPESPDMPLIRL